MMYVVNDIENFLLLDTLGVFSKVNSDIELSLTNIRLNDFSILMQKKVLYLISKGLFLVEVDIEFYQFDKKYKNELIELGDGDKSSIYQALTNNDILISNSKLIINVCNKLGVRATTTEDFVVSLVKESKILNYFKLNKIA